MPPKSVKADTGKVVVVKSVMLANGNLLIPRRTPYGADWVEVSPEEKEYKRWLPVAVDEEDPRLSEEYLLWKAQVMKGE